MAEIFGVAASAIGVVGVAAQCADGIKKLREFCNDVKNAPQELSDMADELELLTHTIAGIEKQIKTCAHIPTPVSPVEALRFCQKSVQNTASIVEELSTEISRRNTGALRAAWKKKSLQVYMTRIERAKTSLALSYSVYSR